jgi:DNA-directed primase/polymerase protein
LISISPITCGIIFLLLQNDKDVFMESLICRLDDNCEKLLICKLDLECKKTLHFDSEISMSQVSV